MITQQDQPLGEINHHKVGDEMLGRGRWLLRAKEGGTRLQPGQRLFDLRRLQLIVGAEGLDEGANGFVHMRKMVL